MKNHLRITALLLTLCLCLPQCLSARAASDLTTGQDGLALIEEAEGFRRTVYQSDGKYYIGYGTQCSASDYPDGVTREQAEMLLREKLSGCETKLNALFDRCNITPTQGQFDALISFTYSLGSGWMSGTSDLKQIVCGEKSAARRETAQAFGEWCHSGGKAQTGLAERRLQEAALYLDGSTDAAGSEFAYLIIRKDDGVTYETDFRVYTIGEAYGSFPGMEKTGYQLKGLKTKSGKMLTESSIAAKSETTEAVWEQKTYSGKTYSDVGKDCWFYDYVMELSANGVISGNPDGTYAPDRPISAGEALKLVLLAAGHGEKSAVGEHWAGGYGSYALSRSYITADEAAALDDAMPRLSVARLAAKALGYGASVAATPFADCNDGFVTALYEAGVLTGSVENGETLFKPSDSITRAEVAAIVYRIYRLSDLDVRQTITYNEYTLDVLNGVPTNDYVKSAFSRSGSVMDYAAGETVLGIDVSQYQGKIDWNAVKADGVRFVIVRVGGRGYTEGKLYEDTMFEEYVAGASKAGLTVGVYFFSQAISTAEAKEEAEVVLEKIKGHEITGPVVFDWEVIGKSSARTYGIETDVLCDCANTFCGMVKDAGYTPMIYFNKYAGYVKYDLREVLDYDFWFAEYDVDAPGFYYDFQMWQYTSKGRVNGISGNVDMDLWFKS